MILSDGTPGARPALTKIPATLRRLLVCAGCAMLPLGSGAPVEAVDARVDVAGPEDLKTAIETGSLVVGAAARVAATPQDLVAAAHADYANILGILYGQGYYGPVIHIRVDGREAADLSPLSVPAEVARVEVQVQPGRQFTFGRAAVGPLTPATELPEGFASGKPAKADLIKDAVGAAIEGWREEGRAKAAAGDRRIVAKHPSAVLDAEVAILPGPLLRFGNLRVEGNQRVRTDRIRQIAGLPEGKRFSPERLDEVRHRLTKTGAFKSVAIEEAEHANPDGTLDITAALVEQAPRRFGFGAELSSTEGLKLSAYWMHRNLLHGAENLRFDAEISGIGGGSGGIHDDNTGIDYTLAAHFARPGTFAAANTLTAMAEIAQLDEPDYFERRAILELGLERELSKRITVTAALQYRFSDVEDDLGKRQFQLLLLPLTGQIDARDEVLNARNGYFLRLEAEPFLGLADTDSGARFFADARVYRSFGDDGPLTLAGRVQVGSVLGAGIRGVPPDMLFFSGGGGTVRGQPYQSLNVDLGDDVFTGGRSFLGLSAEARVRVRNKISVVGFFDWGAIGEDSLPGDGRSHSGAGLGLRYDTPIGPIRLDVAAPVSGDTGEGVQIYVGIGQAF
jgi:translocation and assembly module TamA